jgi:hypothetical protein
VEYEVYPFTLCCQTGIIPDVSHGIVDSGMFYRRLRLYVEDSNGAREKPGRCLE